MSHLRIITALPDELLMLNNIKDDALDTNYWETNLAKEGYFFLSFNNASCRLLIPEGQESILNDIANSKHIIVTQSHLDADPDKTVLEIMFEDNTETPLALQIDIGQTDLLPAEDRLELDMTIWTKQGMKVITKPCLYRKVKEGIPYLKTWSKKANTCNPKYADLYAFALTSDNQFQAYRQTLIDNHLALEKLDSPFGDSAVIRQDKIIDALENAALAIFKTITDKTRTAFTPDHQTAPIENSLIIKKHLEKHNATYKKVTHDGFYKDLSFVKVVESLHEHLSSTAIHIAYREEAIKFTKNFFSQTDRYENAQQNETGGRIVLSMPNYLDSSDDFSVGTLRDIKSVLKSVWSALQWQDFKEQKDLESLILELIEKFENKPQFTSLERYFLNADNYFITYKQRIEFRFSKPLIEIMNQFIMTYCPDVMEPLLD